MEVDHCGTCLFVIVYFFDQPKEASKEQEKDIITGFFDMLKSLFS